MKKTISLIILCLAAISLQAQDRFSYSIEVAAGVGVGRGPRATFTPQYVVQYELGGGFKLGAGAGLRIALPCYYSITRAGKYEQSYCDEIDLPVFVRLGYGKGKLFANLDAGYALGLFSFYGPDWFRGAMKDPSYKGFFVEPQIGMRLGRHSALALGVLLQQNTIHNGIVIENGTLNDPDYSSSIAGTTLNRPTPAFTLRYAYYF